MKAKKCFKCGLSKDESDFYIHKAMTDGHLGKCKECTKKDANEHRNKNIDRIRAYDRQRGKLPHRIKSNVEYTRKYRKVYPLRYAANTLLGNAVERGKVKRPKICSMCKKKNKVFGHHKDYYKPLDVIWVCQICHKELHKTEVNYRSFTSCKTY